MTVSDKNSNILQSVSLGMNHHSTVAFQNTSDAFVDETAYNLSLTCLNKAGLGSEPVTTVFHIDSNAPTYTGELWLMCKLIISSLLKFVY